MDLVFKCPHCDQELAVDSVAANSEIECPTCQKTLRVPESAPGGGAPGPATPPPREEKHFVVPSRAASDILIQKPLAPLEAAAKEGDRKMRVKTIKHGDCVEVGKDKFDEIVTGFLEKIGEVNVVSITPLIYSHGGDGGRGAMTDYAVMIVFRG